LRPHARRGDFSDRTRLRLSFRFLLQDVFSHGLCTIRTSTINPLGRSGYDFAAKSRSEFIGGFEILKAPTPEFPLAERLRPAAALLIIAIAMPGVDRVKL
jgi:hypothetical protein